MKYLKNVESTIQQWDKEYKKGYTSYIILLLLKGKAMYGYEIKNRLEELAQNDITYRDSGIYQILKNQNKKGFLKAEVKKSEKGPNRKYYSISESGHQLLEEFTVQYVLPMNKAVNELIEKNFKKLTEI